MEPVLGGRDDHPLSVQAGPLFTAAMEPVLGGRDDGVYPNGNNGRDHAAMEPVLGGRDDLPDTLLTPLRYTVPQWSPSLADGTTTAAS